MKNLSKLKTGVTFFSIIITKKTGDKAERVYINSPVFNKNPIYNTKL